MSSLMKQKLPQGMRASISGVLFFALGIGACKSRLFNQSESKAAKQEQYALDITEQEYALLQQNGASLEFARCAAELGALPDFSCGENDLDETKDRRTPELIDRPYTRSIEQFVGHVGTSAEQNYEVLKEQGLCDNPAQLGGGVHCFPNSRVGALPSFDRNGKLIPHVKTGFICRRYEAKPKAPFIGYSDIALVQTNIKTGRTCFYQFLSKTTEEKNPSPFKWESLEALKSDDTSKVAQGVLELENGSRFFFSGGTGCTRCHDSDPLLHTRHVESVIVGGKEVGRPILPKINWGLKSNYELINFPGRPVSKHIIVKKDSEVNDGRDACMSCHKMGVGTAAHLLSDARAKQYFGDFLDDHKKLPKSRLDAGLSALKACISEMKPDSVEFTAQTDTNVTVNCQVESLPKVAKDVTTPDSPDDTPRVSLD